MNRLNRYFRLRLLRRHVRLHTLRPLFLFAAFFHPFATQFDHFVGQHLLTYMQPLRTIFDIHLTRDHVRNNSDRLGDVLD